MKPLVIGPLTIPFKPLTDIQPFTYRDALTFLEIIERLREYLNKDVITSVNENMRTLLENYLEAYAKIVEQGEDNLAAVIAQGEDNLAAVTRQGAENLATVLEQGNVNLAEMHSLYNSFTDDITALVNTINNKSGSVPIQRVLLEADYVAEFDWTWPQLQPVFWEFTQDSAGGHNVIFPPNVMRLDTLKTFPGATSTIITYPTVDGWIAYSQDRGDERFNVKDFGAVADGATDDSQAFKLAIAAITNRGGGELYIPPGDYWLKSTIELADNMKMTGNDAVFVRYADAGEEGYTVFRSRYGHGKGYGRGLKNFQATGLTFKGSFLGGQQRHVNGFSIYHGENIVLRDLTFIEALATGHLIDFCGSKNILVDNVRMIGMNVSTGNYQRAEAIQLDVADLTSSSAPEDANDADFLPCVNVVLENIHAEAVTVNNIRYPAPIVAGSHTLTGNGPHRNITIRNVTIVEPHEWTSHQAAGMIHFVYADGIFIDNISVDFNGKNPRPIVGIYGSSAGPIDNIVVNNLYAYNYAGETTHGFIATDSMSTAEVGPVGTISITNLKCEAPKTATASLAPIVVRVGSVNVSDAVINGQSRLIWASPNSNTGTTPGDIVINRCRIHSGARGAIYVEGADRVTITDTLVNTDDYNNIHLISPKMAVVTGNNIKSTVGHSQVLYLVGSGVEGFAINNNMITANPGERGIRAECNASAKGAIVGNVIKGGTGFYIVTTENNTWTIANNATV